MGFFPPAFNKVVGGLLLLFILFVLIYLEITFVIKNDVC